MARALLAAFVNAKSRHQFPVLFSLVVLVQHGHAKEYSGHSCVAGFSYNARGRQDDGQQHLTNFQS